MQYFFCISLILIGHFAIAQKSDSTVNLYLQLGGTYIPVDNNGGLALGLRIGKEKGKFSIAMRNDIIPDYGRLAVTTGTGTQYSQNLELQAIQMNTYADAIYSWNYKPDKHIYFSLGYGWISTGGGYYGVPSLRYETAEGLSSLTSSIRWNPSWFTLELRGNIPFSEPSLTGGKDQFPIALSLYYDFMPGGK